MRAWQIASNKGIDALQLAELDLPEPGPGQVKVRLRANSINYRDLSIIREPGARGIALPRIPNSDGAGDVVAVGPGVAGLEPGDRVVGCFFQNWIDGPCSPTAMASALGGPIDGLLTEEAILDAAGVVRFPAHLSYAEAATLPCAALTAWRALIEVGRLKPGQCVLLLGTGGVSIFALQIAGLLGARAIVTSSSDAKLKRATELGGWGTINYRDTPEWERAVLDMTGGSGVDVTVEVGGPGTLQRSIAATRVAGTIALIGVLTGGQIDPLPIMRKSITLQGIYVAPRRMFEEMNAAFAAAELRPIIHGSFPFEQAPAAYHAMADAGHFGKIAIEI